MAISFLIDPVPQHSQGTQGNEVDDVIREMKKIPGFYAYAILNNDGKSEPHCTRRTNISKMSRVIDDHMSHDAGIVIKCENMSMRSAVHHAHQILGLCGKASKYVRQLLEGPDVSPGCG